MTEDNIKQKTFIATAWPYVNGDVHVGHLVGYMLPGDIFARFSRLKGGDVLWVSGSDCHGTPITIEADKRGVKPIDIVNEYDPKFRELIKSYAISYDLFTTTITDNHKKVTQDMFVQLLENGFIFKESSKQYYSEKEEKFLPDRYVEGTCPYCGTRDQRADQCENCGRTIGMGELIDPKSKLTGSEVTLKETEHYFLDFPKLQEEIKVSINRQEGTREWVRNEALGWIKEGLQPRAITRDIDWGVEIPSDRIPKEMYLNNMNSKRFYVWFDAVIGYLSAAIEWTHSINNEELTMNNGTSIQASHHEDVGPTKNYNLKPKTLGWQDFWLNPDATHYYFMGQDNLAFHMIFWPGQLIGTKQAYNLPNNVSIVKFLNLAGQKFSKSRGVMLEAKKAAEDFGPDAIRFYLSMILPENKTTDWVWEDFKNRVNGDLAGNVGNFIHRVLTFYNNKLGGQLSNPSHKLGTDVEQKSLEVFEKVTKDLGTTHFVSAINEILKYSTFGNQYFDHNKPWELLKTDRAKCEEVIYDCLQIVWNLRTLLTPFLPHAMSSLSQTLGVKELGSSPNKSNGEDVFNHIALDLSQIKLQENFQPLFKKIEEIKG